MNDLISRSALIEQFHDIIPVKTYCTVESAVRRIKEAPAVDAVPVVRCRDCKHYERGVCVCPYLCVSGAECLYPQPEHYCSYGERRNGDD